MIDLAILKEHLGIEESDESQDDIVMRLEAAAVAYVQNETGWYFGEAEAEVYLRGSGTSRLWLPQPATGDIAVLRLAHAGDEGTEIVAEDDDGFVARGAQLVRKNNLEWDRAYEYKVTFDRGYAEGEEPADIRQLVIDLVSAKYSQRGKEGMKSETYGGYSYTFADADLEVVAGAREVIDYYRGVVLR